MAIYGDMLLYFTEQFETTEFFDMVAKHGSGYDIVTGSSIYIEIIKHNLTANEIKSSNGNLVNTASFDVWTRSTELDGKFMSGEEGVFRLQKNNNWIRQAGFYAYDVIKVVGDDGQLTNDNELDLGTGKFI
jgi:hypothetical protein